MSKFDSIRVISFDLDDTLWPTMQTIVEAERQLFRWLEENTPELARQHSIESLRAHRRELALANPGIAHDMNLTRELHLRELFAGLGYDTALAGAAVEHFQQHRNRVFPYEDVRPVLERLREEFILVSVTNGTSEVEKTPLAGLFDRSFNAVDAGQAMAAAAAVPCGAVAIVVPGGSQVAGNVPDIGHVARTVRGNHRIADIVGAATQTEIRAGVCPGGLPNAARRSVINRWMMRCWQPSSRPRWSGESSLRCTRRREATPHVSRKWRKL